MRDPPIPREVFIATLIILLAVFPPETSYLLVLPILLVALVYGVVLSQKRKKGKPQRWQIALLALTFFTGFAVVLLFGRIGWVSSTAVDTFGVVFLFAGVNELISVVHVSTPPLVSPPGNRDLELSGQS